MEENERKLDEITEVSQRLKTRLDRLLDENKKSIETIKTLKEELDRANTQTSNYQLKKKYDLLKNEHKVYEYFQERKFNDLTIQFESMEKFYMDSINALKKEISKLNQDIEDLNEDIQSHKKRYDLAEKILIRKDKEVHDIEMENYANVNKIRRLELENSSNFSKIDGFTLNLSELTKAKNKEKPKEIRSIKIEKEFLAKESKYEISEEKLSQIKEKEENFLKKSKLISQLMEGPSS